MLRKDFKKLLLLKKWINIKSTSAHKQQYVIQRTFHFTTQKRLANTASTLSDKESSPRPVSEVPGMKSYPIIGSLLSMLLRKDFNTRKYHQFWLNLSKEYGSVTIVNVPFYAPLIIMTNPDDIETMYRCTMDNPIRKWFHSLKKAREDDVTNYFENKGGLLVEDGKEWWRVRSRVQTSMMKTKNVLNYLPKMDEVTLHFLDRIGELQTTHGEMPENFLEEIYKWALESVGLVALNRRLGCLDVDAAADSEAMQMMKNVNIIFGCMNELEANVPFWRFYPTPTFKKLKKAHRDFLEIVDSQILQTEAALLSRLEKGESSDELTLMESLLKKEGLTRKDIVTMILDMLFAGIDTTSHAIGFTLYLLSRNPKAQKRLQEEVDSVLGDGKETLNEGHLARLSFMKSCIKESLRLYPIALAHLRTLEDDVEIGGYIIPKGHQLFAFHYASSMNEAYFPRAGEYLPERWGRDRPLGEIHPFASLPFSHGPRMCIGRRISEQEMYTFIARVMHRFTVNYKYDDIEIVTKFVSMPSEPLRFEFIERR